MAKKNSTKDTEQSLSLFGKMRAIFKNETIHFVVGLVLVISQSTCCSPFHLSSSQERRTRALSTPAILRNWLPSITV